MPIYEYQCDRCGERREVIQKVDAPAPLCDRCGTALKRLISPPAGLVFKGSGWYVTDYARKGKERGDGKVEPQAGNKKEDPKAAEKTEAKTETKSSTSGRGGSSTPASSGSSA